MTQCLLTSLLLVLHRIGVTNPPCTDTNPHARSQHTLRSAAHNLLPELCQVAASQGCHASTAAAVIAVMLRSCQLSSSDSLPIISKNLHLVQAMAQAFHVRVMAIQALKVQTQLPQGLAETAPVVLAENLESANAELEGTLEGSLLSLALYLAQSSSGAQMLLDQAVTDFIPHLGKLLLSSDGGGKSHLSLTCVLSCLLGMLVCCQSSGLSVGLYSLPCHQTANRADPGCLLTLLTK